MTSRPSSVAARASTCAASCTPWPPMPVMSSSRSMCRTPARQNADEALHLVRLRDGGGARSRRSCARARARGRTPRRARCRRAPRTDGRERREELGAGRGEIGGERSARRAPLIANGRVASAASRIAGLRQHALDPAPHLSARVGGRARPGARRYVDELALAVGEHREQQRVLRGEVAVEGLVREPGGLARCRAPAGRCRRSCASPTNAASIRRRTSAAYWPAGRRPPASASRQPLLEPEQRSAHPRTLFHPSKPQRHQLSRFGACACGRQLLRGPVQGVGGAVGLEALDDEGALDLAGGGGAGEGVDDREAAGVLERGEAAGAERPERVERRARSAPARTTTTAVTTSPHCGVGDADDRDLGDRRGARASTCSTSGGATVSPPVRITSRARPTIDEVAVVVERAEIAGVVPAVAQAPRRSRRDRRSSRPSGTGCACTPRRVVEPHLDARLRDADAARLAERGRRRRAAAPGPASVDP